MCLNVSISLSACLCHLGNNMSDKWNKQESRYIDLALVSARKCIALKWKTSKPPAITHWWNKLWGYQAMDNIITWTGRFSDFLKIWQCQAEFDFKSFFVVVIVLFVCSALWGFVCVRVCVCAWVCLTMLLSDQERTCILWGWWIFIYLCELLSAWCDNGPNVTCEVYRHEAP